MLSGGFFFFCACFREIEDRFERDRERDEFLRADVHIKPLCDMIGGAQLHAPRSGVYGDGLISPARDLARVGAVNVDLGLGRRDLKLEERVVAFAIKISSSRAARRGAAPRARWREGQREHAEHGEL